MFLWKKVNQEKTQTPRRRTTLTSYQHKLYVYGGYNDDNILGDLFIYDTISNQWEQCTSKGPNNRSGHTCVTYKNFMILFGGEEEEDEEMDLRFSHNELWSFNYITHKWKEIEVLNFDTGIPKERYFHTSTMIDDKMYIYGGYNSINAFDDLFEFSMKNSQWKELMQSGERPPPMFSHSCVSSYPLIFVYGGQYNNDNYTTNSCQLYEYNIILNKWKKVSMEGGPHSRSNTCMIRSRNSFYLFGGYDESSKNYSNEKDRFFNDFYSFNILEGNWKEINIDERPFARSKHSMNLCNGSLYLFGGLNSSGSNLNDLFYLNLHQDSCSLKILIDFFVDTLIIFEK